MTQRPPRDTTPERFFEEWLPGVFAEAFAGKARDLPVDTRVRVKLDGEGGGAWDLEVREGKLLVAPAGGVEPPVTIAQTVADWRAVAVGEDGAVDLAPPQASPLDLLFLDPASRQLLATLRGTVRFEVTGYRSEPPGSLRSPAEGGRTWRLDVKFGTAPAGAAPDATITVDAETYAKLRARAMQPPEAFFQGKIKLAGNTGLAMQLGMAMMPRFQ